MTTNMNNIRKDKILEFLLYYVTIGILFPAFKAYTNLPAFYPAIALLTIYTLIVRTNALFQKSMFMASIILGLFLTGSLFGFYVFWFDFAFELQHTFYTYIVPVIIIEVLISYNNNVFNRKLGKFAIFLLMISAVIQIIAEIQYPFVSRQLGTDMDVGTNLTSYPWWVITFSFGVINALPFVMGMMVLTISKKMFHVLILSVFIFVLLIAGFFTALIFAISLITVSIFLRMGIKKIRLYFLLFFIILFISAFKLELLGIAKFVPNDVAQEKVEGIESKIKTGSGSATVEGREDKYTSSWDGFQKNVLFGQGSAKKVGGHSFWLDKLSQFGIIGSLPYILFLFILYKRSLKILPQILHYAFGILLLITFVIMLFNPYEFLEFFTIIFVYSPIIGAYFLYDKPIKTEFKPRVLTRKLTPHTN